MAIPGAGICLVLRLADALQALKPVGNTGADQSSASSRVAVFVLEQQGYSSEHTDLFPGTVVSVAAQVNVHVKRP